MTFEFPGMRDFLRSILIAPPVAAIAYFIGPHLAVDPGTLALGAGAGALLGALLGALRVRPAPAAARPAAPAASAASAGDDVKSIFVGNLSFRASREELEALFSRHGEVRSVRIMTDRVSRRPRGFGFVEMPAAAAEGAIRALDGHEFLGRRLRVSEGNGGRGAGRPEAPPAWGPHRPSRAGAIPNCAKAKESA